jgi:hypothetical protein
MVFTAASEDYNLYSFDVRKLDRPLNVHMDHVAAVIDVDYSPTGKLFNLKIFGDEWTYCHIIPDSAIL